MKVFQMQDNTIIGIFTYDEKPEFVDVDPRFISAPDGSESADVYWRLVDGNWLPPLPPEVVAPEQPSLSSFQAKAVLEQYNLLGSVKALIDHADTPIKVKLAWENAVPFKRDNPLVLLIASQLGLSNELLDELFAVGALITPDTL